MTGLRIVDAIGPFFRGVRGRRINWSKIPFAELELDGRPDVARWAGIREEFDRFLDAAAATGFNAISLDDVAHLALHPDYTSVLRGRIEAYRTEYRRLLAAAARRGLKVFLNSDVMFFPAELRRRLSRRPGPVAAFLGTMLEGLLADFPDIAGVILRIGESDGVDVRGDFQSELVLRTPAQACRFLHGVLPVFVKADRLLIFRTWSVGAYPVGDLIWNRNTFRRAFRGLDDPRLIVSMKHGESDFFRYLPLNRQFFRGPQRKLIEFQARREYEGFGAFPSFTGWDCENHRRAFDGRVPPVGLSVWCQTGGWGGFRRRTFLDPDALWNELNTFVNLRIWRDDITTEEAVAAFCAERRPGLPPARLLRFLRLSDEVVRELLYIDEFSRRKLFFRRLRVPPLLWVYWDHILINPSIRQILRCFVTDGEAAIRQGHAALEKIREMIELAVELGLPRADLDFQLDTFQLLAAAREYYFRPFTPDMAVRLKALARVYRRRHPGGYTVLLGFEPMRITGRRLRMILRLLIRGRRGYRVFDRVFTLRLLALLHPLLRRWTRGSLADFAENRAMGWTTVLK